ncbi:hypothetical protein ACOI1C_21930 [Bacillus sp. DJP31]|uniref:hypothetical protein n=1 Tax=Bacillus sp. DJP31 TaxID=3409789 RepID=UPI003BB6FEE5
MYKIANINYIIETESYIEEHKNKMPNMVYEFIKEVCQDERKYIDLVEQMSHQKGVLKVPEPRLI